MKYYMLIINLLTMFVQVTTQHCFYMILQSIDHFIESEVDNLWPHARRYCENGYWNKDTGQCVCDPDWDGLLCGHCLVDKCVQKSRITSVYPQKYENYLANTFQFRGHGFPVLAFNGFFKHCSKFRSSDNAYHCYFNDTQVDGLWIDSTHVDCNRPENGVIWEKHKPYRLSLIPRSSTFKDMVIESYEHFYFDIYDACRGRCILI